MILPVKIDVPISPNDDLMAELHELAYENYLLTKRKELIELIERSENELSIVNEVISEKTFLDEASK
jgi:hypothetical protein